MRMQMGPVIMMMIMRSEEEEHHSRRKHKHKHKRKHTLISRQFGTAGKKGDGLFGSKGYNLQDHMGLTDDNQRYLDIRATVRDQIAHYRLEGKKRKQDPKDMAAIYVAVEKKYPELKDFENSWPIQDMVTRILCNRTDYKKNRTVQSSNKKEASEERNNRSKEVSEDQDNDTNNQDGEQSREEYTNGDADTYQPATDDNQGAFGPDNKSEDIDNGDPAPSDGDFSGDLPELTSSEDVEEEEVGDNDRKEAKKADPCFKTQMQGGSKIHHIFIPPIKEKPRQKGPAAAPSVIAPHQPTPPPSRYSTRHKVSQQVPASSQVEKPTPNAGKSLKFASQATKLAAQSNAKHKLSKQKKLMQPRDA
ncbi:hypothetical protein JB92DRAFT_2873524 [Gautieria morchelliformis]|nr:hypothetical protein JB92DRAFT_2873524 [Gautieria morchelliformis]